MPSLFVWMNGAKVGEWSVLRGGASVFRYEPAWQNSERARALSLSLPLTANLEVRGAQVEHFFDNLLPENPQVRRRMRTRFQTDSTDPFDLLSAIGRDCAGAVQLLPPDRKPQGWDEIDAHPLTEEGVERLLLEVTSPQPIGHADPDDFRISIAGAQEKTALLRMASKWFQPRGATPTTHILKLPLGIVGHFRGDLSESVENEWLCAQLLRQLDFRVAVSRIEHFGEQKVLAIERFDRRWQGVDKEEVQRKRFKPGRGVWIARIPQEDFCQALGLPPTRKYQADGGPSIADGLALLAGSERADSDVATFMLAQFVFWLLAAIDGHGKNFSLYHQAGGSYGLTPLYDVLSAWPVIGHGKNQLALEKAKLAMAIPGKRPHYRLMEIQARHWQAAATFTGVPNLWERMREIAESVPAAFDRVEKVLPRSFPERVFTTIRKGTLSQAARFLTADSSYKSRSTQ